MKLHELAKSLGKSNTDTKLLLTDLGVNFDGDVVADNIAQNIINQAQKVIESAPTEKVSKPKAEPKQDDTLSSARAINYQANSEAEQAILEGFAVRGATLANLASAVETNSFINQLTRNKADFASLFLASVSSELSTLMVVAEGKLLAPASPLEQLKGLQLKHSENTQRLQPSNWLKSSQA